jgi:hypothetical protein
MKIFKVVFLVLTFLLLFNVAFQFLLCTRYSFPEPRIFNGEKLYNPYQGTDSTKWRRANFHLHTRQLFGLTAGASNTVQSADSFYNYFNYDIRGISDYMKINASQKLSGNYIPIYEHGFTFNKTHQIVINAKRICWKDYFFRERLNDKQYIINCLKKDTTTLVSIVHPKIRNAYSISDFRYLCNYDCFEIANSKSSFVRYYDAALSAGHRVFIMADDDAHDLSDISDGAHCFTMINGYADKNSVLMALKTGKSYGVCFNVYPYATNYQKKEALGKLPAVKVLNLRNDTIFIRMESEVDTIRFIGQNGIIRKISTNCDRNSYYFRKDDTYIRTEIVCADGTIYYMNPIFRYSGSALSSEIPQVNIIRTSLPRIIFVFIILLMISLRKYSIKLPHIAGMYF